MSDYFENVVLYGGPFDIILDPEIGPMELQEMGLTDRFDYNGRHRFAYARDIDIPSLKQLIYDIADGLGIDEEEGELVDRMTDKVIKIKLAFEDLKDRCGYWVTFFYNAGVGNMIRQGKADMLIKRFTGNALEIFDFYENRKKVWIQQLADGLKEEYGGAIRTKHLNHYVKHNEMLWVLEELLDETYDVYDLVEDVNQRIVSK